MNRATSTPPSFGKTHPLLVAINAFWATRPPRERSLIALAALVVGTALVWQIAIAPALETWQEAPARQAALDAQTGQMLQLQAQAKGLRTTAPMPRTAALQLLESSAAQWLGPEARVSLQGEQVRITFKAAPGVGLSHWLAQARSQAQALPVQAQLQQTTPLQTAANLPNPAAPGVALTPAPAPSPTANASAVWSGTVVLGLR